MQINKRQLFFFMILSSMLGAFGFFILMNFYNSGKIYKPYNSIEERQQNVSVNSANVAKTYTVPEGLNFLEAANKVTPGVVHIKSLYGDLSVGSAFDSFLGRQERSSGSGVIISDDGFIATNEHVIGGAGRIEVVLNDNRTYRAKLVGSDKSTDLALLKIEETNLPFVEYGDSDNVFPGQWVLAVGNPFDLNSTVTAGIVSAKARNIGILSSSTGLQIESFIQTDAAVNPGNSGGALIDLAGELIGINTAIATRTGYYQGYSFAVPVSLVKKVMDDLLEFGEVKRGLLGVRIGDMNADVARTTGINILSGVYISSVNPESAAAEAGLQEGDVIIKIDDRDVKNVSELQELVARNRPGDEVVVSYFREGLTASVPAILRDFDGNTDIKMPYIDNFLEGAEFETVDTSKAEEFKIKGGVEITFLDEGKWKSSGFESGFIITAIDKVNIFNLREFVNEMKYKDGGVLIEGLDTSGNEKSFAVNW